MNKKHNPQKCQTCKELNNSDHGFNLDIETHMKQYMRHKGCKDCFDNIMKMKEHYYRDISPESFGKDPNLAKSMNTLAVEMGWSEIEQWQTQNSMHIKRLQSA